MRQRLLFVAHVGFALLTALLLAIDLVLAEVSAGQGFILADAEIAASRLYSITGVQADATSTLLDVRRRSHPDIRHRAGKKRNILDGQTD